MLSDLVQPLFILSIVLFLAWLFPMLIIVIGLALGAVVWGWEGAIVCGLLGVILRNVVADRHMQRDADIRAKIERLHR